jgi:hypothetical protein
MAMLERLIEIFCEINDFCQAFEAQWQTSLRWHFLAGLYLRSCEPTVIVKPNNFHNM